MAGPHRIAPLVAGLLLLAAPVGADPPEHIGKPVRGVPLSKAGKLLVVSGAPGFDREGKLAVGDFAAQTRQAMENVGAVLEEAGADWSRVVKAQVFLTRSGDFAETNRIYAGHFPNGTFPARTTVIVAGLPNPDFLAEIECEAVAE